MVLIKASTIKVDLAGPLGAAKADVPEHPEIKAAFETSKPIASR